MKKKNREFFISNFQASSPACTELETVVMNWLGKMIGLPEEFLHTKVNSTGGGAIQVSTKHWMQSVSSGIIKTLLVVNQNL